MCVGYGAWGRGGFGRVHGGVMEGLGLQNLTGMPMWAMPGVMTPCDTHLCPGCLPAGCVAHVRGVGHTCGAWGVVLLCAPSRRALWKRDFVGLEQLGCEVAQGGLGGSLRRAQRWLLLDGDQQGGGSLKPMPKGLLCGEGQCAQQCGVPSTLPAPSYVSQPTHPAFPNPVPLAKRRAGPGAGQACARLW